MKRWDRWLDSLAVGFIIAAIGFTAGCITISRLKGNRALGVLGTEMAQGLGGVYQISPDASLLGDVELQTISTLYEVKDQLKENFYKPIKDDKTLTYGAIRGMLAALDDPYTRFLEPEDFARFDEENRGTFQGIGAELEVQEREPEPELGEETPKYDVVVSGIIEGGPAETAGLLPGDIIVGVDGRRVRGMRVDAVAQCIRGERGTKVVLQVLREGHDEPLDIEIVRDVINFPIIKYNMREGGIGYVWLTQFSDPAPAKLREAINDLKQKGMRGLLLDLTGNPGGYLEVAVQVGGFFLGRQPIAYVQERGVEEPIEQASHVDAIIPEDLLVVCLVNPASASASEIVAGALQDMGRATIVGQHTFGKSKVQSISKLSDGSAILITTALWLTPHKRDIGEPVEEEGPPGVQPDVAFEEYDIESHLNASVWHEQQIVKAIDVLEQKIPQAAAIAPGG